MNVFISYDFELDRSYKETLSNWLKELGHRNYSLNVKKRNHAEIWEEIYRRSWVCSVIIVLVGRETAQSKWIEREINECLKVDKRFQESASRRVRKPKGVLAIQLPGGPHPIPKLVDERLIEETALSVDWDNLSCDSLDKSLDLSRKRRRA